MEAFFIYFAKASIGIFLFYLIYYLVLRRETFYVSNRLYLLFGLLMAVLLPAFPVSYEAPVTFINNEEFFTMSENAISDISVSASDDSGTMHFWRSPILILSTIYLLGAAFFLLRLVFQTAFVTFQLQHGKKLLLDGVSVININRKVMPFSFFNCVIINTNEYSKEELSNIVAHEKIHIQERHWVDLLIIELLAVVFWINPIVWLYEKSIKQNHEYLADQGVLLAGYHPGQYQALLINQLMGVKILGFTNNLHFSLNKKRMEMMKKEKSPGFKKVKLLITLPVVGFLILAFAKPEFIAKNESDPSSFIEEKMNQEGIVSQSGNEMIQVKGKVMTEDGTPLTGANVILKGTTNGTVVDRQGEFQLHAPKSGILVYSFIGYKTVKAEIPSKGEVAIAMEKGVFSIELPDVNDPNFKMQLPPPPPPQDFKKVDKEILYMVIEQMPYYQNGGIPRLALDLKGEIGWILTSTSDRGEAMVGFTVDVNSKIVNPHIIKSTNSKMLDESAVKIIAKLDNWWAGMQRGKRVPVDMTVPVKFE